MTLHLTLKKKWFDLILSGEKKEEYREIKDYWCKRFCSKEWYKYEVEILHNAIELFPDVIEFKKWLFQERSNHSDRMQRNNSREG